MDEHKQQSQSDNPNNRHQQNPNQSGSVVSANHNHNQNQREQQSNNTNAIVGSIPITITPGMILLRKIALLNAIETERRNYTLQKLRLQQLRNHYVTQISQSMRQYNALKEQLALLQHNDANITQEDMQRLLREKTHLYQQLQAEWQSPAHERKRAQMLQITKENEKLAVIISFLKFQLVDLWKQYHWHCAQQQLHNTQQPQQPQSPSQSQQKQKRVISSISNSNSNNHIDDDTDTATDSHEDNILDRHIRFLTAKIAEQNKRTEYLLQTDFIEQQKGD